MQPAKTKLATPGSLLPSEAQFSDWVTRLAFGEHSKFGQDTELDLHIRAYPMWQWELATSALRNAIDRYTACLGMRSGLEARAAVGEALWWVTSLDEFIMASDPDAKGRAKRHFQARSTTRHGRLIGGLVFLRNRTNHQLAPALVDHQTAQAIGPDGGTPVIRKPDGRREPLIVTASLTSPLNPWDTTPKAGLTFSPLASLPPADAGFEERFDRDAMYEEEVALRPVADVLNVASESFRKTLRLRVERDSLGRIEITIDRYSDHHPHEA